MERSSKLNEKRSGSDDSCAVFNRKQIRAVKGDKSKCKMYTT